MNKSRYDLLNNEEWLYQRYFVERWTQERIAAYVGSTTGPVKRAIERFGWATERRGHARVEFTQAELREDLEALQTVAKVAEKRGCSPPTVRKWLSHYGIEIPSRPALDDETLRELAKTLEPEEIAEQWGRTEWTVRKKLQQLGVEVADRRRAQLRLELTRDYLVDRYENQKWSMTRISEEAGCTKHLVMRRLEEYGIARRKRTGRFDGQVTREQLLQLYEVEQLSTPQIGRQLGMSPGAVAGYLAKFGIRVRSAKEGFQIRYPEGRKGSKASRWKGGRILRGDYYFLHRDVVAERWPDHPRLAVSDWTHKQEHDLVMEAELGRILLPGEVVHHGPGGKLDNRLENLTLKMEGQHISEHFADGHKAQELQAENAALREEIARLRDEPPPDLPSWALGLGAASSQPTGMASPRDDKTPWGLPSG